MVKTFISILRGINVSGKHLIRMAELSTLYEGLNFSNVTTYIQSGNVIFNAPNESKDNLEEIIRAQIKKSYYFDIPIQVFPLEDFKELVNNNPFSKEDNKEEKFMHFTFIKGANIFPEKKELEKYFSTGETLVIQPGLIYLYCPGGYGNTKLNNTFF